MGSKEYHEGKIMENNEILHSRLSQILNFDRIENRGETNTKSDVVGYIGKTKIPISIKHSSQKNTQVHLPTLKSFANATNMPSNITLMLEQWLGVTDQTKFESWLFNKIPTKAQLKYKRLFATDIPNWLDVVDWFNTNNKKIAELLIQAMNNENPAKYLVWVYKNKNTYQIVDILALIHWIHTDCKWTTGSRNNGSTLRCEGKNGKPIFHLQMKGSGGKGVEYNHNPQFHIYANWPESVILHQNKLV